MDPVHEPKAGSVRRSRRGLLATLLALAAAAAAAEETVPAALPGAEPFPVELRARLTRALAARGEAEPRTRHRRPDGSPLYTNRLVLETSPYLQQHGHNPVDWHPWGDEAFATARRLERPVLVSIGYSTCHWCHVMEEESFDDPEVAAYLNRHFVAIKVDREVRPDVDAVYMAALQAMGQRGGWPLNVFLTPDRRPFYGGTYFPPRAAGDRPGFLELLQAIEKTWREETERIDHVASRLSAALRADLEGAPVTASHVPGAEALHRARRVLGEAFDATWGGVGRPPKFPSRTAVRFLLRYHRRTGDAEALAMALLGLERMAAGGIHDQIGGGFHRYATDRRWRVPHFEKMLYDNALLGVAYLEAWQATGRDEFARVVRSVLGWAGREMTAPGGGFYSATDADSPGPGGRPEEGLFFTWTPAEVRAVLDEETAAAALAWWGIREGGDLDGRSIPHTARAREAVARELGIAPAALDRRVAAAREGLARARRERPPPLRDEKILAGWNGLMISAFARAGFVLDEPDYTRRAERAADFVLGALRVDGGLRRVWKDGHVGGPAFLTDHAFLIAALLDLYEAAPEPRWLAEALALQAQLDARYADGGSGGYFQTGDDQERLLARAKPARDGAIPSGNSVAALNLLRLHALTGDDRWLQQAGALFSAFHETLARSPEALTEMLLALDFQLDTAKEVIVVRPGAGREPEALLAPLRRLYVPNRVLARVAEGDDLAAHATLVPLVRRKVARDGRTTVYVCENQVCDLPTSNPAVLARQLEKVRGLDGEGRAAGATGLP